MKVKILEIGGRIGRHIYNLDAAAALVKQGKLRMRGGSSLMGEFGHPQSMQIDLAKISHEITDLRIEDGKVYATIRPLGTPMGGLLHELIDKECDLHFAPRGYGRIDADGNITDYQLITIDLVSGK